jgi:predicted DNA-binding transcriptional regulator YafY
MDRFDRIYAVHRILSAARYPVPRKVLQEKLECSRATISRIFEDMRDFLGAPIEYDRTYRGYRYAADGAHPYELPGLWFSADELYALLASHQLLSSVQPALLEPALSPLRQRIEEILSHRRVGHPDVARRIRILQSAARHADVDQFRRIAGAVIERRRIRILYHGRERDETTERTVSPQRLIYYRDNWYLDAWCHLRRALRSFSLDRMHVVEVEGTAARDVAEPKLDAHYATAYGIFAGRPTQTAVLRFTPERARWVADEHWHPEQESKVFADGGYELRVPYSDPRELVMEILKYGPDVEVVAPASLRSAVAARLRAAAARYAEPNDDDAPFRVDRPVPGSST